MSITKYIHTWHRVEEWVMAVLNQIKVAATTTRKVPTFDIGHVMWKEIKGIHRNMNCELELF